jgi:hypothetical protein
VLWEKIAADRLKVIEERQKEIEALKLLVKEAGHIHVDETGWKENGKLEWVWAFKTGNGIHDSGETGKRSIGGGTGLFRLEQSSFTILVARINYTPSHD